MSIEEYLLIRKARVPDCNDKGSILTILYEAYRDAYHLDDALIKAVFHARYRLRWISTLGNWPTVCYGTASM